MTEPEFLEGPELRAALVSACDAVQAHRAELNRINVFPVPDGDTGTGTAAALMNLLYVGDVTKELELTPSYYNRLFRSPLSFRAVESRCRAMDDPHCELIVNPLSPGLNSRLLKDILE